jgi:uncharacterized protein (DUF362 family)
MTSQVLKESAIEAKMHCSGRFIHGQPVLVVGKLTTYAETVPRVLSALQAGEVLRQQERILIKPNLIEVRPAPVTTDVKCVEAIVAQR